jgi:hypothetical protein
MNSQEERILEYLEKGYSLTAMGALNLFQCFRLASRINALKNQGHNIVSKMRLDPGTGKRYAQYSLDKVPNIV